VENCIIIRGTKDDDGCSMDAKKYYKYTNTACVWLEVLKKLCASRARCWFQDFRHNIISARPLERVFQILYNNAEYPHSCLAAVVESDGHVYRQTDGKSGAHPA
jgi:hypothetical protein